VIKHRIAKARTLDNHVALEVVFVLDENPISTITALTNA
jgi:hypothetical protein